MTILFILAVLALVFLYIKGWLTFTYTGVLRPLVNLTVFGFAVSIKKPDAQ